ncbi:hypothetical protein [Rheinheimera soli]|uniref:6-pyruvoyl-tetrahydropterin synthase n=1 Tax=Rheinheimera soli TaxID=443616 RepID=A0ABU1VVH8_9GAMM|nr:hypothetical protein [Rheinheimera soli]MDR7119731.1 6-pyruvoyl-tetrahydropterin synthase [Rheinheimera soli]
MSEQARQAFSDNYQFLLDQRKLDVKSLVKKAKDLNEEFDYSYFNRVLQLKSNPTIEKVEQMVRIARMLEGCSNVEMWMFFIPNYFKNLNNSEVSATLLSESALKSFLHDILYGVKQLKIIDLSPDQYEQIMNFSSYLLKKNKGHTDPLLVKQSS